MIDGWVWGRGALDMKGGVAMMLCAVLRAKAEGVTPAGDVILTIMADEEAGSDYGARFLTEQHPEQFEGARYAIGEGGGSSQTIFGQRYYPGYRSREAGVLDAHRAARARRPRSLRPCATAPWPSWATCSPR